ncbi:MAG: MDR/zinc-dependent alcohol dehydrogenase-like family protein [Prochlorothrix sp.]|nr:alcohol dehydrogenase catalytic domain-containing protein [Prochlorothrix sp.]
MNGLWLEQQQLQWRTDLPTPHPSAGEALVRVLRAGICNTDLELLRGYYPYQGIPGHEFVGVVETGDDTLQGQRVVGEINAACGQCSFCQRGIPTHCQNRTVLGIVQRNGAFAEYLSLPVVNLHPVPDSVTTEAATFTEPLAAALEIQEQVRVNPGDRVLVVGDGKLGQLVAQTLALTGCDLQVLGRHPEKLGRLETMDIATTVDPTVADRSFDVAVDCTGHPSGFDTARTALKPRGTLVMKSTYAGNLSIDASALVVDEITVVGSRCGPFDKALALLASGQVEVESLIQGQYPLDRALEAFDQAQTRGQLKILLSLES